MDDWARDEGLEFRLAGEKPASEEGFGAQENTGRLNCEAIRPYTMNQFRSLLGVATVAASASLMNFTPSQ